MPVAFDGPGAGSGGMVSAMGALRSVPVRIDTTTSSEPARDDGRAPSRPPAQAVAPAVIATSASLFSGRRRRNRSRCASFAGDERVEGDMEAR